MQHFILSSSLRKLQDICYPDVDDQRWFSNLEATHWLDHIKVTCSTLMVTLLYQCPLQYLHHVPSNASIMCPPMPPSCALQCLNHVPSNAFIMCPPMPPSRAVQCLHPGPHNASDRGTTEHTR